ncbi:glycine receptor subunit alphaZ1-like [Ptychodera flava]|uniref:glycine receptor subunit alphaZ1-like n=1 Tax=Ptychodera flava TaxID=63121 RepID=UPI00396AA944
MRSACAGTASALRPVILDVKYYSRRGKLRMVKMNDIQYLLILFMFSAGNISQVNKVNGETKIDHSVLLGELLANHDNRIRPNLHGPPVVVLCGLYIRSFDSISETTMDYTLTTYFRHQWNDPRLMYDATGFINMNGDIINSLWIPDLYFENAKQTEIHSTTKDNLFLRVYPNGDVYFSIRLGLILTCNMHLERFPMDQQRCKIEVETYSYTTQDMKLLWFEESPLQIDSEVVLPQYKIASLEYYEITRPYTTGNYSHLIAEFILQRELGFYMLQAYIPSILLVILSWVSLWMEPGAAPARVALGITTVLALVTQGTWMRSQLPKVAYATAIDIWMVTCQVFVFAALLEFAIVYYLNSLQKIINNMQPKPTHRLTPSNGVHVYPTRGPRYAVPTNPSCKQWITRSSSLGNVTQHTLNQEPSLRRSGNIRELEGRNDSSAMADAAVEKLPKQYGEMAAKSDRYSRILFPIMFLVFNAFYWYKFLILPGNH